MKSKVELVNFRAEEGNKCFMFKILRRVNWYKSAVRIPTCFWILVKMKKTIVIWFWVLIFGLLAFLFFKRKMHQICSIHWYLLCFSDNKILKTNPLSISLHLGYFITPFWFWKSYLSSENGSARTQSMFRVSTTRRRHLNTNQPHGN